MLISEALGQALADHVDVVIPTHQSTLGASSEILVFLVIVDALALEFAARHRDDRAAKYKMNRMREAVVGSPIDLNARPQAEAIEARLRRPGRSAATAVRSRQRSRNAWTIRTDPRALAQRNSKL